MRLAASAAHLGGTGAADCHAFPQIPLRFVHRRRKPHRPHPLIEDWPRVRAKLWHAPSDLEDKSPATGFRGHELVQVVPVYPTQPREDQTLFFLSRLQVAWYMLQRALPPLWQDARFAALESSPLATLYSLRSWPSPPQKNPVQNR